MKSESADFSALASLKFLDDALTKLSNDGKDALKKRIHSDLHKLSYDLYHRLPSRKQENVALYTLVDPRLCKLKNQAISLVKVMQNPEKVSLTPEIHSQILNLARETLPQPINALIAANLSQSIEKILLEGGKFQPLHAVNLM
jgi:hypothetical protein